MYTGYSVNIFNTTQGFNWFTGLTGGYRANIRFPYCHTGDLMETMARATRGTGIQGLLRHFVRCTPNRWTHGRINQALSLSLSLPLARTYFRCFSPSLPPPASRSARKNQVRWILPVPRALDYISWNHEGCLANIRLPSCRAG